MLQLPETKSAGTRRSGAAIETAPGNDEGLGAIAASTRKRLADLEAPILDAKVAVSIVATLASSFGNNVAHYRKITAMTAAQMAVELEDDIDQILFIAFKADAMLRELEEQYLAPLDESGATAESR